MEQAPMGDQEQLVPAAEPAVPSDGAPAAAPAAGRAGAPHGNGWASALNDTQREVPSWDLRQGGSVTRSVGPEERRAAEKARCDAVKAEDKKRAPTAYLLKFLSGESSQVGEDLSCYAPALSAACRRIVSLPPPSLSLSFRHSEGCRRRTPLLHPQHAAPRPHATLVALRTR